MNWWKRRIKFGGGNVLSYFPVTLLSTIYPFELKSKTTLATWKYKCRFTWWINLSVQLKYPPLIAGSALSVRRSLAFSQDKLCQTGYYFLSSDFQEYNICIIKLLHCALKPRAMGRRHERGRRNKKKRKSLFTLYCLKISSCPPLTLSRKLFSLRTPLC